jgi:hypothetical protein
MPFGACMKIFKKVSSNFGHASIGKYTNDIFDETEKHCESFIIRTIT